MTGDDLMVLAEDARVIAVGDLPRAVRGRLGDPDTGYVLSRRSSRSPSLLIDEPAAMLVAAFREPRTIVAGVLAYSEATRRDPRLVLEDAYPLLERLVRRGFLVAPGTGRAGARLAPGAELDGFVVDYAVQILEDSEVHLAHSAQGDAVAVKYARPDASPEVHAMLAREARVLRRLDGDPAPRLLAAGTFDGGPYLVSAWYPGMDVAEAAAIARVSGDAEHLLRALGAEVLEAYSRLHRQGVVHGDVHARNVLVDARGHVLLLDFGLARMERRGAGDEPPPRRGVGFSFEPEFAGARRRGLAPVAATAAGEQYAVAALVYLLLTGSPYVDFRLDDELWRQIEEAAPLAFADRGLSPWPAGEAVLARALSKEPGERFGSVHAFARSFRRACDRRAPAGPAPAGPCAATALLDVTLRRLDGGPARAAAGGRACSAHSGAAGIAIALLRLACIRDDPALLARADAWAQHAVDGSRDDGRLPVASPSRAGAAPGPASLHHGALGALYVRALVSIAQADAVTAERTVRAFCAVAGQHAGAVDVVLGAAGGLLACANLVGALQGGADAARREVIEAGDALHASIVATTPLPWLGAAHGSAGLLYASLCWTLATGRAPAPGVATGLAALRGQAALAGRRACWPRRSGPPDPRRPAATGWCHGSAGHAHLWCAASAAFPGDADLGLGLAERAAHHAARADLTRPGGSLCCGWAGQAYACLAVLRSTGDAAWRQRAHALAERAGAWALRCSAPDSLYAGALGVALLAADLEDAPDARMPLFEPDGWPLP